MKKATKTVEELSFTVGTSNTHNLEMPPAVLGVVKGMGLPIIIQVSADTAKHIGAHVLVNVVATIAKEEMVGTVLHLDHVWGLDDTKEVTGSGYTSVMYNGSYLPFRRNILKTKVVVEYVHAHGVSVEREFRTTSGTEEGIYAVESGKVYTRPEDIVKSVEAIGVDVLATAADTNYGQFKSKTEADVPLLRGIDTVIDVSLAIHGGTGMKEEGYSESVNSGTRKFNVGTELLVNWTRVAKRTFGEIEINKSLYHNVTSANEVVREIVKHKTGLFMNSEDPINSENKRDEKVSHSSSW